VSPPPPPDEPEIEIVNPPETETRVTDTRVSGMNNKGEMIMQIIDYTDKKKAFICKDVVCTEIEPDFAAPDTDIYVFGVNDSGDVLGRCDKGYFLKIGGDYELLGDYPGATDTTYTGINNSVQLVGYYEDSEGYYHGFLYDYYSDVFTSIDDHPDAAAGCINFPCGTFPTAINNADPVQLAGYYSNSDGVSRGFVYDDESGFTPVDHPDALPGNPIYIYITGINDLGQLAGYFWDSDGYLTGFVKADGHFIEIEHPDAASAAEDGYGTCVLGITNSGQVSGWFDDGVKIQGFTIKNILPAP
jgi:hypothetical protein